MAYYGMDFQSLHSDPSFIYLQNTPTAKNSTFIVGKLLLSAKRVSRSLQQTFSFLVRAALSTRVIGAVVTRRKANTEIIRQFAKSTDIF